MWKGNWVKAAELKWLSRDHKELEMVTLFNSKAQRSKEYRPRLADRDRKLTISISRLAKKLDGTEARKF